MAFLPLRFDGVDGRRCMKRQQTRNVFESSSESESESIPRTMPKRAFKPPDESMVELSKVASGRGENDDYMTYVVEDAMSPSPLPESSLKTSIINHGGPKSIGLSIMEKMGYSIGTSLGKDSSTATNLEPIAIQVKTDTMGLGAPKKVIVSESDYSTYKKGKTDLKWDNRLKRQVNSIMKLCFELSGEADKYHEDHNVDNVSPLWREYVQKLILREIIEDYNYEDRLLKLIHYLRVNHNYCWYCGCNYQDVRDLEELCPGPLETDHT